MVLSNDFGTVEYFENNCQIGRESLTNPTIRNLISENGLKLNVKKSLFTNLHMGLRRSGTNIKRDDKLTESYKTMCFKFFISQLHYCNPDIVICLG